MAPATPRSLERLRQESLRIAAALPSPEQRRRERQQRSGARWAELARSGELARRLELAAPLAAIGFAIFAFGGVYGWAYGGAYLLIFAALAAWSVQCWRGTRRAHWRPVYAALLAFTAMVGLQLASSMSVVPAATDTALLHVSAGVVAFVLIDQLYQARTDATAILAGFSVLTAALALLAIMQILTASTGIYWHFTYAYASPAGSFVNRNNFAGCMEMLIPAAVAAAYQHRHRDWLHLLPWVLAPALGMAAMVLAASRGGMLALAVEMIVAVALYARLRQPGHRPRWWFAAMCVAAAAALIWAVGTQRLSQRLEASLDASAVHGPSLEQRRQLDRSTWSMFRARPALGWGLGTWSEVYPAYARFDDGATYAYAHNDYLQMLAETGLAGAACGLAFWGLWGWDVGERLRRWRQASPGTEPARALGVAAVIACSGMLVHSWVDFNLHIPANLLLFFALLALAGQCPRGE